MRGMSALVTLGEDESPAIIPTLELGQQCTIDSSSEVGFIDWIDSYGCSFSIKPRRMVDALNSENVPGYLSANETITLA